MAWLARLKNAPSAETDATKATKPVHAQENAGFVGFVAPALAVLKKIEHCAVAVDDAKATATDKPDRLCWPASTAMNGAEIETFTARWSRFTDKGMTIAEGEVLADMLVNRDREQDDRHSCFECIHHAGAVGWRCGNWQRAGVAIRARDAQLPSELVYQLHRCDGFSECSSPRKRLGWNWHRTV
jgi:hypothetical protein